MPAQIDPELSRQIEAGKPGPFGVTIEFAEPLGGGELAALGVSPDGRQAVGWLNPHEIRALAQLPQALSIRLAPELGAPPPQPKGAPKTGLRLASALRDSSDDVFDVIVTFQRNPGPLPEFPGLTVHGNMGDGRLDREAIARLAAMDSVVSIETQQKFAAILPRIRPAS